MPPDQDTDLNTGAASSGAPDASQQSTAAPETAADKGSSDVAAGAAAPAGDTAQAPAGATSSPKADEKPKSALEHVERLERSRREEAEKAAGKAPVDPKEAAPDAKAEAAKADAKAADDKGWISTEDFKKLPGSVQRRIGYLTKQQGTLTERVKQLEPKAQNHDQLTGWIGKYGVTQEEFSAWLGLLAAVKHDPARAWESIQPTLKFLREQVGDELPEDLRKRVADGEISDKAAKEIAKERNERTRLQDRDQARDEQERARAETERRTALANEIKGALAAYETQWKSSDPDYQKKWKRVWDRMTSIMAAEGRPSDKVAAVELFKRARKEVDEWLGEVAPRPQTREITPLPQGSSQKSNAKPRNALEAADRALAAMTSR